MKQLFKGQISFQAVFSKQAQDSYYHGILAATDFDETTQTSKHSSFKNLDNQLELYLEYSE